MDEKTLFGVASVSKAFTAAALALLVDEGTLSWDDPVVQHLPGFRLYDPYVTETVTVRDLLSHRVGVGRMTGNRLRCKRFLSEASMREMHRAQNHIPDPGLEGSLTSYGLGWSR